jgi:hypothetical protein
LLELEVNGRVERFSTSPSIVPTDDGRELQFREGLGELVFELASDLQGGEVSVPIEIAADSLEGVSLELEGVKVGAWAALVAALHELEGSEAVLYRWTPGTNLEAARVMLRGFAEEIEHGGPLEPLVFTLRRLLYAARRPILAPEAKIDAATWPISTAPGTSSDEKVQGVSYCRIYGYPGIGGRVTAFLGVIGAACSPAPLAQYRSPGAGPGWIVVADQPIEATLARVYDFNADPPLVDTLTTSTVTDGLGREVTVVDLRQPGSILSPGDPGRAYYVGLDLNTGGGTLRRDRSGPIRGMGELIATLLEETARIDVVEIDPRLDAWLVDTWINEAGVDPWDWITRELGPLCPFRLHEGRLGLAVRLMDWRATKADAVARFDVDLRQLDRVSQVRRTAASGIANRIVVEYRPERSSGTFAELVGVDAETDPADPRIVANLRCFTSRQRLARPGRDDGVRELVIQSAHTWDQATARLIASYKAAELALPRTLVEYRGPSGLEQRLDPADVVILNDSEVGLLDRVALVDRITVAANETRLGLVVLENPAITERATL